MAVIRSEDYQNSPINYVAAVGLICCMSCMILMLKFMGFKASLKLTSRKKESAVAPNDAMIGAYRVNRDEFQGNGRISVTPKKLTPSMVKLPPSAQPGPELRQTKSTSNLLLQKNLPAQIQQHRSTHDISQDPRGAASTNDIRRSAPPIPPERKQRNDKSQEREQKKIEKQRIAEEKARQKAAAQEQARQEKIRREREKQAAQEQARLQKKNRKKTPAPKPQSSANPLAKNTAPPLPPPPPVQYSTNTLESSISRSSGPPPYSAIPPNQPSENLGNSNPVNVSFSKPIDNSVSSWDMISQHRQQMSRPATTALPRGPQKHMVMDLQYKLGGDKNNSEA